MLMLAAVAYADNVANNLDTTIDSTAETMSLTVGGVSKTTVIYVLAANNDGENGCNLKNDASLTVNVSSSDPAKATVSPSQVTIDGCDVANGKTITVTPVASGSATITFTQAAFTGSNPQGTFVYNTATFTAIVAAPADATAPTGSVAVNGNATYTNSTAVSLDLAATDAVGVTAYRVANGSDCSSALWQAVSSTTSFNQTVAHTLTPGDGTKTVCAQYKDAGGNISTTATDSIVLDTTAPAIQDAGIQSGTAGANGWYLSAVVNRFTASDSGGSGLSVTCSATFPRDVSTGSNEGTGVTVSSGACSDLAGNTNTGISSAAFKIDLTDPSAVLTVTAGTAGANGWYTSNVTVATNGSDSISGPVTCTPDQSQTTETAGHVFDGSCTNTAGRSTNAAPLTVKLDKTAPSAALSVTAGMLGANGWYTSNVTVATDGSDSISGPVTCTPDQSQTTETAGQVFDGSCTNKAGLSSDAAPLTVKLDKTAPSALLAVTDGTAGANGWYTSNVTVATNGSDSISGPVTCTPDQSQTAETTGEVFNGSCTNTAGLSADAVPLTVKLDKTAPSAMLKVTAGAAGANGWYTSDVTVATNGTDSISSPVSCTGDQSQTDDTTGEVFNGSCTNDAGLTTDAAPLTVKLDKSGPSAVLAVAAGAAGANGWYTTNVTVDTSGTDTISGPVTCTPNQSQTTETAGQVFNGSCTNKAGLTTNAVALTVKLDKTAPSATLAVTGTPGSNGWFIDDVTVSTSGADTISGPVTCTPNQSQTTETTGHVFNGSCTNQAGLIGNAAPVTVKLDKTNPSVAITSPVGGTTIASSVTVSGTDGDATSGIASVKVNGSAATLGSGTFSKTGVALACGSNTINVLATDNAGRTSTDSITVTRQCFGLQFLQPLDQSTSVPVMNKGKYGRVIPVKVLLSVAGGAALDSAALTANGWTLQMGINGASCQSGAAADDIEAYADAGQSAAGSNLFRWDGGQWIYNLDTKSPPGITMAIGSCYRLDVYVSDGANKVVVSTSAYAVFQPTK
jgi:hypothetical protein